MRVRRIHWWRRWIASEGITADKPDLRIFVALDHLVPVDELAQDDIFSGPTPRLAMEI